MALNMGTPIRTHYYFIVLFSRTLRWR